MSGLLTYEDVAERLQLSVRTIREMRKDGTLKGFRVGKRAIRFHPDDIEAYTAQIREEQCRSTSEAEYGTTNSRSKVNDIAERRARPQRQRRRKSNNPNVTELPWAAMLGKQH